MTRRFVPTTAHGVLDYLSVAALWALPRALGWSAPVSRLLSGAAVGTLVYSLTTRYELGAVGVLPMKAHLAMDAVGGASLCALPFASEDADQTETAVCCAIGGFDMLVSMLTETEPAPTSRMSVRQQVAPMSADKYRVPRSAAREARESIGAWS